MKKAKAKAQPGAGAGAGARAQINPHTSAVQSFAQTPHKWQPPTKARNAGLRAF